MKFLRFAIGEKASVGGVLVTVMRICRLTGKVELGFDAPKEVPVYKSDTAGPSMVVDSSAFSEGE